MTMATRERVGLETDFRPKLAPTVERTRSGPPPSSVPTSPAASPVDLLCATPSLRLDAASLKQSLTFAFASGAVGAAFEQAIARARLPASTWDAADFAPQLFLPEFIASCLDVEIEGQRFPINRALLARVLASPPAEEATVELRRSILDELAASADARREFERAYAAICRFRALLETAPMLRRANATRRRLDILGAAKASIDALADAFDGVGEGLERLHAFGTSIRESAAYTRLADLLDYDEHLATLDVRVRLGADGRVRGLELLTRRENAQNTFYSSPVGRFFTRLMAALRGYRFNDEEVLTRLVDAIFEGLEGAFLGLFQLIGDMEFYLAALAMRDNARARGLAVCLPELVEPNEAARIGRSLEGLFNPLLLAGNHDVVPCDIVSERFDTTVIITGPNSGGKTRLLQSLALAQLLGQGGFFVPATRARLVRAPGLFVSIIEQARADQSEGRLGTELLRVRALFERLRPGGMVVVDELCSGTNPSEGEEIFELVVALLAELRPQAFITTHFLQLAAKLEGETPTPRLAFLQVELDARERPTYQFARGVARTSLARRTAERLGVTRDELQALVEKSLATRDAKGPARLTHGRLGYEFRGVGLVTAMRSVVGPSSQPSARIDSADSPMKTPRSTSSSSATPADGSSSNKSRVVRTPSTESTTSASARGRRSSEGGTATSRGPGTSGISRMGVTASRISRSEYDSMTPLTKSSSVGGGSGSMSSVGRTPGTNNTSPSRQEKKSSALARACEARARKSSIGRRMPTPISASPTCPP